MTDKNRNRSLVVGAIAITILLAFMGRQTINSSIESENSSLIKDQSTPKDVNLAGSSSDNISGATQNSHTEKSLPKAQPDKDVLTKTLKENFFSEDEIQKKCWDQLEEQIKSNSYNQTIRDQMESLVGSWFYTKDNANVLPEKEMSNQGNFFLALAKAGFYLRYKNFRDDAAALRLLDRVAQADSGNSAPYIFMSVIYDRMGDKKNAAIFFKKAESRKYFDSYLPKLAYEIFRKVSSPLDYVEAVLIVVTIPLTDISLLQKFFKNKNSKIIAQQMVNSLFSVDNRLVASPFVPFDYINGKRMLDKIEPQNRYPSYKAISKKYDLGLRDLINIGKTCDLSSLEASVLRTQEIYRK